MKMLLALGMLLLAQGAGAKVCEITEGNYFYAVALDGIQYTHYGSQGDFTQAIKDLNAMVEGNLCTRMDGSSNSCEIISGNYFYAVAINGKQFTSYGRSLELAIRNRGALVDAKVCVTK